MTSISYSRYTPTAATPELTMELVRCYRDVFADRPWNEWKKCTVCDSHWGIKDQEMLEAGGYLHCGQPLVDYWPEEQVLSDLKHEITDDTSCWLAFDGDKLVGFCWGYMAPLETLESKLGIHFGNTVRKMFGHRSRIAYQDELGVLNSYRGTKIAKQLFKHRLADFISQNVQMGIVRTREAPEPSVTFQWFTSKLGYRVLARYPDPDGRVVLGRDIAFLDRLLA